MIRSSPSSFPPFQVLFRRPIPPITFVDFPHIEKLNCTFSYSSKNKTCCVTFKYCSGVPHILSSAGHKKSLVQARHKFVFCSRALSLGVPYRRIFLGWAKRTQCPSSPNPQFPRLKPLLLPPPSFPARVEPISPQPIWGKSSWGKKRVSRHAIFSSYVPC